MKKINWFLLTIFALASLTAQAQQKLDEIFGTDPKTRVNFSGSPTFRVRWARDGAAFLQTNINSGILTITQADAVTSQSKEFYSGLEIANGLEKIGLSTEDARRIANNPAFVYNEAANVYLFNSGTDLFIYNPAAKTARRLTNNAAPELEADFSPDGKMVSFVRGMNLFVADAASGRETQLTTDGGEKILNGHLDWVYMEELYGRGNTRGYWWSPDSATIAFLRTDENPVPKFVLTNDIPTDQIVENTDYPPEDFLISRVDWSPDSKWVIWQAQNREQTFLDLNAADRAGGKVKTLFKETSPAWVEVNGNPTWLADGSFIWESARSGWNHLYHYSGDGKLIRQITDGKWEVRSFYGVDEKTNFLYFAATEHSHIAPHIYRVKLDGTGFQRLSKEEGSHSANFNPTFTHYVGTWSDINTPPQTRLYKADGTLVRVINENKVEVLNQYKLGKPEFLKVKTRDGFEMEAMMIKPPDFDPSKKYPVMSHTYAGPHAPQVRNSWGGTGYMWHQMLAQKGYIIWVLDNRTASGKGVEQTWKAYKQLGVLELQDLEDGVNYLKSLQYVDGSRIGLRGWSYGGFMTSYALTNSNSWKIGIAGGSVTDWRLYDSIYTERYMLTPQNNPQGYDKTSVLKSAKNLNGKLLLIHGVMDDNVHQQNTMQLVYELQKAGKQFELMLYPTQRHGISNPAQARHMYQMMTDFIIKNL
jgi:dipeptidyl-peptidase 4